jgi:hypothetical protein
MLEQHSTPAPIQNTGAQPSTHALETWELFKQLNPSQQTDIVRLMLEHLMTKGAHHG